MNRSTDYKHNPAGQDNKSSLLAAEQKKYLWSAVNLFYENPLALDKGEGVVVSDVDGNSYLDFFGGILTTSVGHSHPKVLKRVVEQAEKLFHTSTLYPHENMAELAKKLAEITPKRLDSSFFTTSGTEANEMAVLAAREYTDNTDFFALQHSYSGSSLLTKSLTGQHTWRFKSQQAPGIKHTMNAYCYRCPLKLKPESCQTACAEQFELAIKTTSSAKIAGILCEPIQGVGGFITPPPAFFKIIAEIARHYGGLFISDEVQGGFGRTGHHWFSISHWGVEPDAITMAKGIANGLPLGNVITRREISDGLAQKGLLLSTFGGNPLATAAANAVVEVIAEEVGLVKIATLGDHFRAELEALKEKYPVIGDVRGKGLMQALEFVTSRQTKEPASKAVNHFFEETKKRGLLIGKGGLFANVVRLSPPLVVSEAQLDEALHIIDASLAEVQRSL